MKSMVIIVKPTYACNFRCKYCYLSHETKTSGSLFDLDFAKKMILDVKRVLAVRPKKKLTFIWHGGEPLLWGIENYREIFAFMKKELEGIPYQNSLQTNLSLINEAYIDLFLEYHVHVGFSLDGTKEINDSQRVGVHGEGTFDVIMEKYRLCREKGVSIGCIVVGSKMHIGRIPELYRFMCENHLNFKFNPIFNSGEAEHNSDEYGVSADEYARMAIELFDLWYFDKKNKLTESNFVEIASNIVTGKTAGCMFGRNCQDSFLAVSSMGDVLPCGRFCDVDLRRYAYGNLHEESLADILPRIKTSEAYRRYENIIAGKCGHCRFFDICHGGCLHDGFLKSGDFKSESFLCPAYKKIFVHIDKRLKQMNMIGNWSEK